MEETQKELKVLPEMGIFITEHFVERFIERCSVGKIEDSMILINVMLHTSDCLFMYKGAKALRTEFGIIILSENNSALSFLEWSYLNKKLRKEIKKYPKNFKYKEEK